MARRSEKDLAGKIKQLLVNCVGFAGDQLSDNREKAYDYYFQRPRGDEVPGRSSIVTGDLSSMIEGNLAEIVEPLTNRRIAEYCSYDPMDEEQANLESDCVNELLFKRQNGFIEVTAAIKDALLLRNGVIKTYVDVRTHVQQIDRENVDPMVVPFVLDQIGQVDVHSYDAETGKLNATLTKTTRKFRVEAIAPENFLLPKDWHRQDLEDIPFCAERHVETRSTLIERGFPKDKVDRLVRFNNPYSAATNARLPRSTTPYSQPLDKSQELVEWYECYAKMDDGSGASELHRICTDGVGIILEDEPADLLCYAIGVAIINPHTFMGISLFDKLKSTQDSTTAMTRALMDNLNATNKNRTASFDEIVETDDLTDGRINGNIRVKPGVVPDVRMAVTAFGVPDTSANILANLEHMRRVRSEMGGAALDMSTGQMQLNDRVGSQGLDRAYSVMEQHAAFMMRMLAFTLIRSMYLVTHEVLRTQYRQPIQFKRGKDWIQVDPSKWPVRESVSMNLGASPGERARMSAVLSAMLEHMAALADRGMEDILVDAQAYYNAVVDWLRINDIPVPERYILDPRTPKAVEAFKRKAAAQQNAQMKQDAMMQQAIALEQVRVALQKYIADMDTQFKYYQTVLNAQIEEAKIATSAVVDLSKAKATAAQAANNQGDADESTASGGSPAKESDTGASSNASGD